MLQPTLTTAISAAASGGGLGMLLAPVSESGPARRMAVAGAGLEVAASRVLEQRLGLSAEAYTTGKAHWHVLVRARAIETGSYVFAANQGGTHAEVRRTWGHALIVNPWGEVLADAGEEVGFVTARIDPAKIAEARGMVPALTHDRGFSPPPTEGLRVAGE
jgi:predicted amidohydrolase